jgi:phosphoadenosine phosphosulfate reductase
MVVLHLALQVNPDVQVFSVMTPFKPCETFRYKKLIEQLFPLNIKTYMCNDKEKIYLEDPDKCCDYYKVNQTREAIRDLKLDSWITGLRRTEGRTRTNYDFIENKGGIIKVNPILDFTELDVWRYLAVNGIPVNPLYKDGYRSLGCEPCSTKEKDENETEREGRWQGTSKCGGECGIHTQVLR